MDSKLLKILYKLQEEAERSPHQLPSICVYVQRKANVQPKLVTVIPLMRTLHEIILSWPPGGKDALYPVPHPTLNRADAYGEADMLGTMWVKEYGANRKELLGYIIDVLEKRCNDGRLTH